ncbi:hypothetical protein Ae201684P_014780 [Aphanomyces euteiches]|nr:hypothetical protein Ae201684P_014780 [Aphanomyces euteiches]
MLRFSTCPRLTLNGWNGTGMIHPDSSPILLSLATSKSAKLRASPAVNSSILPTKHLNLPSNFYEDPKRLTQLAAYLQPDHILPRYGEFIFKTLLRANAMQYLFQYQDPKPTCVFCRVNETYEHFLFLVDTANLFGITSRQSSDCSSVPFRPRVWKCSTRHPSRPMDTTSVDI